jgi:hypothetical protein
VRVHVELDRLSRTGLERQADEGRADAVGDEVGTAYADIAGVVDPAVTVAAGVLLCGHVLTEPGAVEAEPQAVEELDRLGPDAAHLTADVPSGRGVETGLVAHRVRTIADDQRPPVGQPGGFGQL